MNFLLTTIYCQTLAVANTCCAIEHQAHTGMLTAGRPHHTFFGAIFQYPGKHGHYHRLANSNRKSQWS